MIVVFFGCLFLFAWLAWVRRDYAVYAVAAGLPLYLFREKIAGLPTTLLEGMILILALTWGIQSHERIVATFRVRRIKVSRYTAGMVAGGFFFLSSLAAIFVAPNHMQALGLWRAYFLEPLLFFAVFIDTVRTPAQIKRVVGALALSASSIAVVAIIQKFTGWHIPPAWLAERRATSFYPYPNAVGLYLGPIIALLVAGAAYYGNVIQSALHRRGVYGAFMGVISLCVAAIMSSKTEGALVALSCGAFLFGLFWSASSRTKTLFIAAVIVSVLVASPPVQNTVKEKLFFHDWSGRVRHIVWKESTAMLQKHPVFGAGIGGYQETMRDFHTKKGIEIFFYPHDIFLNFWSELGAMGMGAFVVVLGWFYMISWRILRIAQQLKDSRDALFFRASAFGLFFAMNVVIIHGLVDVPYFKNDLSVLFWIVVGLAVVSYRYVQNSFQKNS